jgi:predicted PurR-regulated permease PerM
LEVSVGDPPRNGRASITFVPIWILAVVGITLFLREARTLFVPIALAGLAAYALQPTLTWLERFGLPRVASAALVVGFVAASVVWVGWVLSDDVRDLARNLPQQVRDIRREIERSPTGAALDDLNTAAAEMRGDGETSPQAGAPDSGQGGAPQGGGVLPGALATYLWQ